MSHADDAVDLTHLDPEGRARMVDVGHKPPMKRRAVAEGFFVAAPQTLDRLMAAPGSTPGSTPGSAPGSTPGSAPASTPASGLVSPPASAAPGDAPGSTAKSAPEILPLPKGEALSVARIAGIQAAKRTDEWIPLCHSLPIDAVHVDFERVAPDRVRVTGTARVVAKTGVEMEALVAVSAACLTLYDMTKAVDKQLAIQGVRLVEKTKQHL